MRRRHGACLAVSRLLDTKKASLKYMVCAALSIAAMLAWLFVGCEYSYFDEERHMTFIVKRFSTFNVEFYNPVRLRHSSPNEGR